jgi:hypothetical protein
MIALRCTAMHYPFLRRSEQRALAHTYSGTRVSGRTPVVRLDHKLFPHPKDCGSLVTRIGL